MFNKIKSLCLRNIIFRALNVSYLRLAETRGYSLSSSLTSSSSLSIKPSPLSHHSVLSFLFILSLFLQILLHLPPPLVTHSFFISPCFSSLQFSHSVCSLFFYPSIEVSASTCMVFREMKLGEQNISTIIRSSNASIWGNLRNNTCPLLCT